MLSPKQEAKMAFAYGMLSGKRSEMKLSPHTGLLTRDFGRQLSPKVQKRETIKKKKTQKMHRPQLAREMTKKMARPESQRQLNDPASFLKQTNGDQNLLF